jgi:hypothetical protein
MSNIIEIKLGQGFGKIKLGLSEAEVTQILGKPEEIEEQEYEDGGIAKTYYYNEDGFDLTFESEDDYRLSYMSFYDNNYIIKNKIHTGMIKSEILEALSELGMSEPDFEDISTQESPGQELISFDDENFNLWLSEGILDEIQIGPFWKDDDTPIWP